MINATFFVNLLILSDYLQTNDVRALDVATTLNSDGLSLDQVTQLKEILVNQTDTRGFDATLLKNIVNKFDLLNKSYINSVIDLKSISLDNLEAITTALEAKLNDTTIVFDNDRDKFNYYSLITRLTITTKDSGLIKKAIDLIQTV